MISATPTVIVRLALRVVVVALAMACHAAHAAAPRDTVFAVEDDKGLLLSDREGLPASRVIVVGEKPASPPLAGRSRASHQLQQVVTNAARTYRLPPALLHAVIAVESGYVANAVSRKGAMGLMQLMPATARDYGVTHPFDPTQNVNAGALHLRRLLDTFDHDISLALAAYNAGAGAVRRHGGSVPPFAETQDYVPRVLRQMARLRDTGPSSN